MHFTDIFIRRPVLATVVSLFILVLGLRALSLLEVRQYPKTQNAVVTVTTVYTGADPQLVAGFITSPLESSIAQAGGIDYLSSTSTQGASTITANLRLNYDPNKALTEINAKVNAVLNQLPQGSQQPVIAMDVGETMPAMFLGFTSKVLTPNKITDYLIRVVQPKLQAIEGVQTAEINGERRFALRAWIDPLKLATYAVSPRDITNALAANNYISALGSTKGRSVVVDITAQTGAHSLEDFRNLVIKQKNGGVVRLKDVANVTLGAEDYNVSVAFGGSNAVLIGIKVAPSANLLTVAQRVRKAFPELKAQLPEGIDASIVYDSSKYVKSSIDEVKKSLVEALLIVTVVIFLFLGSLRSVVIPTIAMPLSLVGAFFIMLLLGYSINLLTLLSIVLAIGLVVDDAIIVVENVHRHIEEGATPMDAAINGARELAGPIIAISIVLVAVYIPIGFMGGLTGALFTEFAYTLAGAVAVSALIALTLSPMMCARFLKPHNGTRHSLVAFIDRNFDKLRVAYEKKLHNVLNYLPVVTVFSLIILAATYFLYTGSKSELAPQEDQGIIVSQYSAAPNASLEETSAYGSLVSKIIDSYPETDNIFQIEGSGGLNVGIAGMVLKPWEERKRSAMLLQHDFQAKLGTVAGVRGAAFMPNPLPGAGRGMPLQFVIGTTDSFDRLYEVSDNFLQKARATGLFAYIDTDLKLDKPQAVLEIDKDKAAQLGLTMKDIGDSLGILLGGGYVNYFNLSGRSYKVIPQVVRQQRLNPQQLEDYYITLPIGRAVPLATIAKVKTMVVPRSLARFQQLNSATIGGVLSGSATMGQALEALKKLAKENMPNGYLIDYAGQSRQYVQESSALAVTFIFALIIIFLALAALFESFRDPLIVMVSVPMSICGAMIFIFLGIGGASLNIYTEVGLITLIGLISKHGILIVQFANDLQREGKPKREAVEMAAGIRLRPILMTTAAMVLGVVPLVMATGAGAAGRFNMGLVIMTGISIGTLFTLFVVPSMYIFLSGEHYRKELH